MKAKKITIGQTVMGNILKISYINGINDEWLARMFGVTVETLQKRKKCPGKITLDDLNAFCESTHTDISEVIK